MDTQELFSNLSDSVYFFILKRVKNKSIANDILQNTFFKIHKNLHQLKEEEKAKAWVFQIARNEIANYYNQEATYASSFTEEQQTDAESYQTVCCFNRFINELPHIYKQAIELVYIEGKKQYEAAEIIGTSLANIKARIRRAKTILKENFRACCKYEFDKNGNLVGEPDCAACC